MSLDSIDLLRVYSYKKIKGSIESIGSTSMQVSDDILLDFIDLLESNVNFIIVKYGDGEWLSVNSEEYETNCDGCHYFKELGYDILRSYIYFLKNNNAYICKWPFVEYYVQVAIDKDYSDYYNPEFKFLDYDLLIHKLNTDKYFSDNLISFYKTIKNSTRKKVYVSNPRMISVMKNILNFDTAVPVPEVDSYLQKKCILEELKKCITDVIKDSSNIIFLFSAGFCSKVLIYELSSEYPNNTYIDIGSSFDALIKASRDFNKDPYYKELMTNVYLEKFPNVS